MSGGIEAKQRCACAASAWVRPRAPRALVPACTGGEGPQQGDVAAAAGVPPRQPSGRTQGRSGVPRTGGGARGAGAHAGGPARVAVDGARRRAWGLVRAWPLHPDLSFCSEPRRKGPPHPVPSHSPGYARGRRSRGPQTGGRHALGEAFEGGRPRRPRAAAPPTLPGIAAIWSPTRPSGHSLDSGALSCCMPLHTVHSPARTATQVCHPSATGGDHQRRALQRQAQPQTRRGWVPLPWRPPGSAMCPLASAPPSPCNAAAFALPPATCG